MLYLQAFDAYLARPFSKMAQQLNLPGTTSRNRSPRPAQWIPLSQDQSLPFQRICIFVQTNSKQFILPEFPLLCLLNLILCFPLPFRFNICNVANPQELILSPHISPLPPLGRWLQSGGFLPFDSAAFGRLLELLHFQPEILLEPLLASLASMLSPFFSPVARSPQATGVALVAAPAHTSERQRERECSESSHLP